MKDVFVITWRYSDGSGSGAVCVCQSADMADRLLSILQAASDGAMRGFSIEQIPYFTGPKENEK